MGFASDRNRSGDGGGGGGSSRAPGKSTLTGKLRRKPSRPAAGPATEVDEPMLAEAHAESGSRPAEHVRSRVEAATGADLGAARVHVGPASAAAADAMAARAYTLGPDIHFGAGEYQPGTKDGDRLLGHELVHVIQQGDSPSAPQHQLEVSQPGDPAEHEADAIAALALDGDGDGTAPVVQRPQALARAAIQREVTPDATVGGTDVKPAVGGDKDAAAIGAPSGPVVKAGIDLTAIGQDHGIRVAVGYYSSPADIAANKASYMAHPLKDVLTWGNVKPAGDHPKLKAVVARIAAGSSDADANTTATDADDIAQAVAGNNTEFGNRAAIHATQRKTIGGTAAGLVVGKHLPFDESTGKPIEAIQAISTAIGSLAPTTTAAGAVPAAPATPATPAAPLANVAEIAFFTHGVSKNIGLGKDGWMNGTAVAAALGSHATPSVQVLVYGCNAADGNDSFAATLATALAKGGHKARVFGHTSAGPATVNADGKEFTAVPDGAGGAKVTSATNYEMVFSNDFRTEEMVPVAADQGIDLTKGALHNGWTSNQYSVFGAIGAVAQPWLHGNLSKFVAKGGLAGANEDGSASSEEAAYTLGVAKDPTVAAIRTAWQAYRVTAAGKAALAAKLPAKSITK